jgi:hypothetical protein
VTRILTLSMKRRVSVVVAALLCIVAGAHVRGSADDDLTQATLMRVFLLDGASLVSYGEFARVADRVVFSMPTASTPDPPLQLVNIPADRVDWDRTNRYTESARASRYAATRGEEDYVVLSNTVSRALNEGTFATDPARRLAIVENARKTLAEWPPGHFNYRQGDVRQMLSMLDEAIADLRSSSGSSRFELSLVAVAEPASSPEPLLPPPGPTQAVEQLLLASRLTDSAVERQALVGAALASLDRDASSLPFEWASAMRSTLRAALEEEATADRLYQAMIRRTMAMAILRARQADIRGIRRVLESLQQADDALGRKRPEAVTSARAAIEAQLDAARRLRLARDRWTLRAAMLREYSDAMGPSLGIFRSLQGPLADIKELAGSSPSALVFVQRQVDRVLGLIKEIVPPEECRTAHALLVSAAHLAENAAKIRREATLSGELARAWDASSAAAGALMLTGRATSEIKTSLRPPQLQ